MNAPEGDVVRLAPNAGETAKLKRMKGMSKAGKSLQELGSTLGVDIECARRGRFNGNRTMVYCLWSRSSTIVYLVAWRGH